MRLEAIDMSIREASAFGFQAARPTGNNKERGRINTAKTLFRFMRKVGVELLASIRFHAMQNC